MKRDIKQEFINTFKENKDLDSFEIRRIFNEALLENYKEKGWEEARKWQQWTDDELRVILSSPPTKENCLKYAVAFGRGYGSIEQIYRWAQMSDKEIVKKREDDKFIAQIKKIAKQLGWR